MDELGRAQLNAEEASLIAPCGIYCGACDAFLGKSRDLAKELYRILKGFNMVDVAPIVLEVEQERMKDFMVILERISRGTRCAGCNAGGGNPYCPIKKCTAEKEYLTCAQCHTMPCHLLAADDEEDPMGVCFYLDMITRRYAQWNIRNLERIRAVGYRQFVDEMREKVKDGFLTSDVISSEMVITKALEGEKTP